MEDHIKEMHRRNQEQITQGILQQYGTLDAERKLQDFIDLGPNPFSVIAFHNKFLHQIRSAFIIGAYYPALTATCALGERILNHLVISLRDDFKSTPEYKKVYDKESFPDWHLSIDTLKSWGVLLPKGAASFRKLSKIRNQVIHFEASTDLNDRTLALEAIQYLNEVIDEQFTAFGSQPWFIAGTPGECFIKKEAEAQAFIKKIYLPNCLLVGPFHEIISFDGSKFVVRDDYEYEDRIISDEEFVALRTKNRNHAQT